MTIHTWPTLSRAAPAVLDWGLTSNTQTFSSPLSGSVQTLEMPGARWHFSYPMANLKQDDSALLRAFLVKLRGQSGRFYMHNMAAQNPRGVGGGTPVVGGAGQTGTSLAITGCPVSSTFLKAGDFFEVGGELKMAVADAVSNGSGAATITFEPPLRASPANAAAITTSKPKGIFKLDEDTVRWSTGLALVTNFTIAATEAW